MNDKRDDEDEASFEGLMSFGTMPPPAGAASDVHSARTTVAELPDSFLDSLRAGTAVEPESAPRPAAGEAAPTRRARAFELPVDANRIAPRPGEHFPSVEIQPSHPSEAAPVTPRHAPRPPAPHVPFAAPQAPFAAPLPPAATREMGHLSSDDLAAAVGAALATASSPPAPERFARTEPPAGLHGSASGAPFPMGQVVTRPPPDLERSSFLRRVAIALAIAAGVGLLLGLAVLLRKLM